MVAFDQGDVEVVGIKTVFKGFFKVEEYTLKHRLFAGGISAPFTREVFERGDAVAVLPYDPLTDEVVLVEQFRIGAMAAIQNQRETSSPWLIECLAGMIDTSQQPEDVALREAQEEAAITLSNLQPIMTYYSSPGGMSERIHLFVATVDSTTATGVHGLDSENEDIRVRVVKYQQAIKWLNNGVLNNATTIIALQWLQLNKQQFNVEINV
jgi:ADP-ribose pyrophosphatase